MINRTVKLKGTNGQDITITPDTNKAAFFGRALKQTADTTPGFQSRTFYAMMAAVLIPPTRTEDDGAQQIADAKKAFGTDGGEAVDYFLRDRYLGKLDAGGRAEGVLLNSALALTQNAGKLEGDLNDEQARLFGKATATDIVAFIEAVQVTSIRTSDGLLYDATSYQVAHQGNAGKDMQVAIGLTGLTNRSEQGIVEVTAEGWNEGGTKKLASTLRLALGIRAPGTKMSFDTAIAATGNGSGTTPFEDGRLPGSHARD